MLGIVASPGIWRGLVHVPLAEEHVLDTPFGTPSSHVRVVVVSGARIALLARTGEGDDIPASRVNARANLYAFKEVGVTHVVLTDEVRSLRGAARPGDLVLADQVIDLTSRRPSTFFEEGISVQVEMAQPTCRTLRARSMDLVGRAEDDDAISSRVAEHPPGTYACLEGPSWTTAAETDVLRRLGADVVGQGALPDVRLAREAEMCVALVLSVVGTLGSVVGPIVDAPGAGARASADAAAVSAVALLVALARDLACDPPAPCACQRALDDAVMTPPAAIRPEVRARYGPLLARFFAAREHGVFKAEDSRSGG
jgi:5'-methylthioadenosine phosphorylase